MLTVKMVYNWRGRSMTILCRILVCFFFCQMSWIFACGLQFHRKSHPCIYFSLVCTSFSRKNVCKKLGGTFCGTNNRRLHNALLILLFGKTKGFFCFSFNNSLQKALPSFFGYVFVFSNCNSKFTQQNPLSSHTTLIQLHVVFTSHMHFIVSVQFNHISRTC